jgi:hypothetical protein
MGMATAGNTMFVPKSTVITLLSSQINKSEAQFERRDQVINSV